MSAFVVLWNVDGAPVDTDLLGRMTASLAFRGPDAQATWQEGPIGLGHTLLRTTWEAAYEKQPVTVGNETWLVADARVDAREELWAKLGLGGDLSLATTPDSELLLHAYLRWGEQCVDHVIGDFSFVVWDGQAQRLFCAKDHMGVRQFYYAQAGNTVVLSNSLDCVRLHPGVSDELNELAIGDFLLFDCNHELDTTAFAHIRKLPAAHVLTVSRSASDTPAMTTRRYWEYPKLEVLWLRREEEYVERFREILKTAVRDRLRTDKATVWFSGGLDSTNMAAAALDMGRPIDLRALTVVYQRLFDDAEGRFAQIAADALGIPLELLPADDYELFEGWDDPAMQTAEPRDQSLRRLSQAHYQAYAEYGRVSLYGEGGDEFLPRWPLAKVRAFLPLADVVRSVWRSAVYHRVTPSLGTGLLAAWRKRTRRLPEPDEPTYPDWIHPEFAAKHRLAERFQEISGRYEDAHAARGTACRFYPALWANVLEDCEESTAKTKHEVCLPYIDLRLLRFGAGLPPYPWACDKYLLRQSWEGRLPQEILSRPKSALAGDPWVIRLADKGPWGEIECREENPARMYQFVCSKHAFRMASPSEGSWQVCQRLRVFSLSVWFHGLDQ